MSGRELLHELKIDEKIIKTFTIPYKEEKMYNRDGFPQLNFAFPNCVNGVALHPEHPVYSPDFEVISIEFPSVYSGNDKESTTTTAEDISNFNLKNKGKRKKGIKILMEETIIAKVCGKNKENQTITYNVYSMIHGKVLDINEKLHSNPNLLTGLHKNTTYFALMHDHIQYKKRKLSQLEDEEEMDQQKKAMNSEK